MDNNANNPNDPVAQGRTERRTPAPDDDSTRAQWGWALGIAALVALGFGAYLWQSREAELPPPPPRVEAPAPAPVAEEQAVVEHPLTPPPAAEPPLPALAASDALLVPAIIELLGNPRVQDLLQLPGVVRRLVVTIDNLPRNKLSPENWPVKPVGGSLRVSGSAAGDRPTLAIDPANAARYATYVKLVESVDVPKLVALYVRTYPLFQQAYVELGYPKRYFNDRLLQVLDHLIATPQPAGPLRLTQPKLAYEFADEELQALSMGQKTMLRIGPDNAARVKTKLTALRDEIMRNSEKR
jgi:hypothetical protein